MSKAYAMPSLGSGMEAGTVVEWHVEPGQKVARGNVIGLVDTEKGAIEIEIWEDAEVLEIVAPPGTKVPVGEPLLMLKEAGEEAAGEPGPETVHSLPEEDTGDVEAVWEEPQEAEDPLIEAPLPSPTSESRPKEREPTAAGEADERVRASPAARRRAADLGVDLEALTGTGPEGAVTLVDVEAAERPGEDRHRAMRQAIATAMTRSKREIPHYYLATTLSMEPALRWLEDTNRASPPARRILLASLYLKSVALALADFPELNGFWEEGAFRAEEEVHPGLAISLRGVGLVAPAIHDVSRKSLEEITTAVRDVVQRSRAGRLRGSEVTDPTITVTSLGERGVDTVFGVIYPPQVAIVGVGTVAERPWAEGGLVGSRRTVRLTLAADHRASDGHRGGLFLAQVARLLQVPEEL